MRETGCRQWQAGDTKNGIRIRERRSWVRRRTDSAEAEGGGSARKWRTAQREKGPAPDSRSAQSAGPGRLPGGGAALRDVASPGVRGVPLTWCLGPSSYLPSLPRGRGTQGASSGIPLGFEKDFPALNRNRSASQAGHRPRGSQSASRESPASASGSNHRRAALPGNAWCLSGERQQHCPATYRTVTALDVTDGTCGLKENKNKNADNGKDLSSQKNPHHHHQHCSSHTLKML